MDGMALLRRLQSIDPGLPVILMTGHGDVPMAVEAMRIGAFDFVEKPFEPDRLAELCQRGGEARARTLETRALRRELSDGSVMHAPADGRRARRSRSCARRSSTWPRPTGTCWSSARPAPARA